MKASRFLPLVAWWITFSAFAGGASSGGGRFAEQNIRFAAGRIVQSVEMCLNSLRCNLSADERTTLTQILEGVKVFPIDPRLKIVGKDEVGSDFFKIEGRVVNAKTEFRKDAIIYVNRDFLYEARPSIREFAPAVDVAQSIGILIHELAHQQGVKDEDAADLIGTKVRSLMAGQITEVNVFQSRYFVEADERVTALVINPDASHRGGQGSPCSAAKPCVPQAFLHDRTGVHPIGDSLLGNEFEKIALRTRCASNSRTLQMRFTNLHTRRLKPKVWMDSPPGSLPGMVIEEFGNLYGDLEFTCEEVNSWRMERFGKDQLSFLFGIGFSGGWVNGMLRATDVKFNGNSLSEYRNCETIRKRNRCI